MILQILQNSGLGSPMGGEIIKNTDYLYSGYIVQFYPGMRPNTEAGVTESSWVNCAALYSLNNINFKVGSAEIFQIDGHAMLTVTELMGKLRDYASMIGFCMTRKQLINESRYDRTLFAPLMGLPFHDRPDMAFAVGGISYHGFRVNVTSKALNEMCVNYGNVVTKKGVYALPRCISTGEAMTANAVQFAIAAECVWVSKQERASLVHGYDEKVFREICRVGQFQIPASTSWRRLSNPIDVKGPTAWIAIVIRAKSDIDAGNWVKTCQDSGLDHVKEIMLYTGSTPVEDGLPASFYRTGKIIQSFKHGIDRYIYVFSFETNANSWQMTGHRNFTNSEGSKVAGYYAPSASVLEVDVYACIYNATYTEKGTGGKVWQNH